MQTTKAEVTFSPQLYQRMRKAFRTITSPLANAIEPPFLHALHVSEAIKTNTALACVAGATEKGEGKGYS